MTNDSQPFTGMRCLVLEDEFLISLDIERVLETAGAKTIICLSKLNDALNVLKAGERFDLAVLDFKLAGNSSSAPVATLLAEQNTPFIFLTGASLRGENLPAVPVLQRPFEQQKMIDTLLSVLKR